jgi:hypothetical protein
LCKLVLQARRVDQVLAARAVRPASIFQKGVFDMAESLIIELLGLDSIIDYIQ